MVLIYIKQHASKEDQFMKKLSNTEAALKKSVTYNKKACISLCHAKIGFLSCKNGYFMISL